MVENHYDFINTQVLKSSKKLETIFKGLGGDDSNVVEICGTKVYIPSPNLHALFLLRHMVSHFAASNITLRHVLDWAFFVKAHGKDVDWGWLEDLFEKYHIKDFYNCLNGICVDNLGFTADIFHSVRYNSAMKDKILMDILAPRFTSDEPVGFVSRMLYKYRRWQGNAWKKNLCYSESRAYMFFSGIRMHIMKLM